MESERLLIYKIVSRELWLDAKAAGVLHGAPVDLADGFIHFSSAEQVPETARRHFAGQSDLMLLTVSGETLGDALKWEVSRGGALFPHLYAPLAMSAVVSARPLPQLPSSAHDFTGLLA